MGKFKTAFKGYDKQEVDAYLHKTTEYHESKIRELEECIKRLREENDYLYAKNSEYHRNEERVSGAIVKAMEVKNDLEQGLRKKIALEEDRLKIFKTKWLAYLRGINRTNAEQVIEDTDAYLAAFRKEFIQKASRELGTEEKECSPAEKSYFREVERLKEIAAGEGPSASEKKDAASSKKESGVISENCGFIEE